MSANMAVYMERKYVGELSHHDPLYHYLRHEILPRYTDRTRHIRFRVYQMHSSNNEVYLYDEKASGTRVIGKFFTSHKQGNKEDAARRAQQEFGNLNLLRQYGLWEYPHKVIKPLACNLEINNLLIEEYCGGQALCRVIYDAMHHRKHHDLYSRLSDLAYFLATMHNRTVRNERVDFQTDYDYFTYLVGQARRRNLMHEHEEHHFRHLCDHWRAQPKMWDDHQVLTHGDATPSNFIFSGNGVTAIDLERMKYSDRVFDLGRVVGEIQHHFVQGTGNKENAEPFIGHFLWEYSCHFPDRHSAFKAITARLPFQIAVTLLRVARNSWISRDHAHKLIQMAKGTLASV